jgi:hypothetical protein
MAFYGEKDTALVQDLPRLQMSMKKFNKDFRNALDSIFPEWNRKAVDFVSYGNAGSSRTVEQLWRL